MASKLHKTGSIFARIDGLLKTGVTPINDRPVWYDIYKAYPPTYEPALNKPLPDYKIRPIFYKEDIARAKLHKIMYKHRVWNLRGLHTDQLIKIYLGKLEEGLTEDEAFNYTKEVSIRNALNKMNSAKHAKNTSPEAAQEVNKNVDPQTVEEVKTQTEVEDNKKV